MTTEEMIAFWKSVDIEGRRIEQIYVMVANGVDKKDAYLQNDDESRAWDVIADDMNQNPPPEGSFYDVPSFN